jgi:hypothetical protein
MMRTKEEIAIEINSILNNNQLEDLKRFIKKRQCLNGSNQVMIYFFHVVQSAGILTTTIAAGYDYRFLIWVGVGLNILASLITIFEKTNDAMSKKILKDIHAIKDGNYIDESMTVEVDKDIGNGNMNSTNTSTTNPIVENTNTNQ